MAAFVGRRDELASLGEIAAAASRGDVGAAVVVGDPGSGKSRLLAEIADRAEPAHRFHVTGYEPERQVPLASAADLLRRLSELTTAGRRLDSLVFDAGAEGLALEPVRIFEAAHRVLRVIGPTLVLVDDLQWLDDLSLALCHYLARAAETGGPPLALIAASRPSAHSTAFTGSLGQVLPAERLAQIELGPLASDEALELVSALAPRIGDTAARELAEKSGDRRSGSKPSSRPRAASPMPVSSSRLVFGARVPTPARCSRSLLSRRGRWRWRTSRSSTSGRRSGAGMRLGSSRHAVSRSSRPARSAWHTI